MTDAGGVTGYAVYTPRGTETELRLLLPSEFILLPQVEGDLSARLLGCTNSLLAVGHSGVILLNSDAPTFPKAILRQATDAVSRGDNVILSPALDGGYILIGLSRPHVRLFEDIPWSTDGVYRLTVDRAREIGLRVVHVPGWYDVDSESSFRMLEAELSGERTPFADRSIVGEAAPATRQFLNARRAASMITI